MLSAFSIARNGCRGALWKTLQSRSQIVRQESFKTKEFSQYRHMPAVFFSTSQNLSEAAAHDHHHSKIWTAERFLSAALIGVLPAALIIQTPVLDYALALALTVHVHWGIEAIVVDYLRPSVVGATLSKVSLAVVYALSVFTLGGLFYFNYNDVGLSQAIRMLWKL